MNLQPRLQAALDWINPGDYVADVGCDHGFLAMGSLEKGASFVQLIDNKQGPLTTALHNMQGKYPLSKLKFSLSNGLDDLDISITTICICGMGGLLISKIIAENINKINNGHRLILEANNKVDSLREFLFNNHFTIIDEKIIKEKNIFYELILAQKIESFNKYSLNDIFFGPVLLLRKDPLFCEKWNNILKIKEDILSHNPNLNNIKEDIKRIKEVI